MGYGGELDQGVTLSLMPPQAYTGTWGYCGKPYALVLLRTMALVYPVEPAHCLPALSARQAPIS
jgi:hypothetical protein